MSTLAVGNIELVNCQLLGYEKKPILEPGTPHYLATRHLVHVRGTLNPATNAYSLGGGIPALVPVGPGVFGGGLGVTAQRYGVKAPVTDYAIRFALEQPRQRIKFSTGNAASSNPAVTGLFPTGDIFLESPRPGAPCDANNGPFCKVYNITECSGTKTFKVELAIQTDINESYLFTTTPPTILAHVWTMQTSQGPDFYAVRTIKGRAVFNTEMLFIRSGIPDQFRAWLFHPVPLAFKRDSIDVEVSRDGTALEYTVVDKEQAFVVLSNDDENPTRIESTHHAKYSRRSLGSIELIRSMHRAPAGITGVAWDTMTAGFAAMPRVHHTVAAKVWGNRLASRSFLAAVARGICADRLSQLPTFFATLDPPVVPGTAALMTDYESDLLYDNMGTYVEASVSAATGPASAAIASLFGGAILAFPNMPADDWMNGHTGLGGGSFTTGRPTGIAPTAPGESGARGTYLGALVAQTIKDAVRPFPVPLDPPDVTAVAGIGTVPPLLGG